MDVHITLTTIDYAVIASYIVAVLTLGLWVSFRKEHSDDLFLAGRSLGWGSIGLSIFGTNVSPAMMISSCSIAYTSGMVAANFEWLAWLCLLLFAMVFLPHYLNTQISTMPEFMSRRYGEGCRIFVSWYTLFATVWIWIGGTLFVGGLLLGQITGWPLWMSVVFLAVMATSFTVTGGLAAVVITDAFQSILMIGVSAALAVTAFVKVGSLQHLIESVPPEYWKLFRSSHDSTFPWHAVVLGYPVMGVWFWCTDQTIVQRALGGRDLRQGQLGAVFVAFLKIITPFIFFMPGILCKVLHPNLEDPTTAYMTMVSNYMPVGVVGLIAAVLMAASITTLNSGLNSLSTVFTLDIYRKHIRRRATPRELLWTGRIVAAMAAAVGIGIALAFNYALKYIDLFSMGHSMIGFLAPSMASVFLVGILWRRATSTAALLTLILGTCASLTVGVLYLFVFPAAPFWPHFLLLSFYLFVGLTAFMIIVSCVTKKSPAENDLPSIASSYDHGHSSKAVWIWWAIVAVMMVILFLIFN